MTEQLTGMVEQRVDERNRVALPSRFIGVLRWLSGEGSGDSGEELSVVVGLGLEKKLCVFPKSVHDELLDYLNSKPEWDPKWRRVRSVVQGSAEDQKLDKQNRIKVPPALGKRLGLEGTIVVQGAGKHLELVSTPGWERELDEYSVFVDELAAEERARA